MLSILLSLFTTNKSKFITYGIYGLIITCLLGITYLNGYSSGQSNERNRLSTEYVQLLEERINSNTETLTREFEIKLNNEKINKQTQIVYKDRQVKVKNVLEDKNSNLGKNECDLLDTQFNTYNQVTRKVK